MARTSTYLNFPRNTEEAFNFYKSIFGGEFSGNGVARFGDFPPPEGAPQISEDDKNLIMHIELPITGGHVLMATDAPGKGVLSLALITVPVIVLICAVTATGNRNRRKSKTRCCINGFVG